MIEFLHIGNNIDLLLNIIGEKIQENLGNRKLAMDSESDVPPAGDVGRRGWTTVATAEETRPAGRKTGLAWVNHGRKKTAPVAGRRLL
jgi:hypothetical protein